MRSLARRFVRRILRPYRDAATAREAEKARQEALVRLAQASQPYRLNLGCGWKPFAGWVNIDVDPSISTPDVVWDLSHGIPVADGSCALLYCEHFLEHLSVEQGLAFLNECRRVLQPDGILRIAMPSLDAIIEKAANGQWREQDWLTWPEHQFIKTRAEMLNIAFRWWGHQWLYDREELHRRLGEAGFRRIVDVERGQSVHADLRDRETRNDSLLVCEVQK